MAKPKNSFMVMVEWADACGRDGWAPLEEYLEHSPASVKTVGWLINKNSEFTTVALSICETGDVSQAVSIPSVWVRKIKYLK